MHWNKCRIGKRPRKKWIPLIGQCLARVWPMKKFGKSQKPMQHKLCFSSNGILVNDINVKLSLSSSALWLSGRRLSRVSEAWSAEEHFYSSFDTEGFPLAFNLPVSIYAPGWRSRHRILWNVLPKNITQRPWPWLEPRPPCLLAQ